MATAAPNPLSLVLIALMKGVIERVAEPAVWQSTLELQARIRDHVAVLGLELVVDEAEGFAYLRQRPAQEGEAELPRLVSRRQLGYQASLLLALLRKKLTEFDAACGDTRLILSRDEIAEMLRLFLPNTQNQVRLSERIDANINRVAEMGFLRKLHGTDDRFEVRRILKAFVDGQWLAELNERLNMYRMYAESERIEATPNDPN